jgi:two-component system chemotaxis response regulator CheY
MLLQHFLAPYGECHIAVNGQEALQAVRLALSHNRPYDLLSLDIDMPEMDGHETLKQIRKFEDEQGIFIGHGMKIIMSSAHREASHVLGAFREGCEAYLPKPVTKERLVEQLTKLGLVGSAG